MENDIERVVQGREEEEEEEVRKLKRPWLNSRSRQLSRYFFCLQSIYSNFFSASVGNCIRIQLPFAPIVHFFIWHVMKRPNKATWLPFQRWSKSFRPLLAPMSGELEHWSFRLPFTRDTNRRLLGGGEGFPAYQLPFSSLPSAVVYRRREKMRPRRSYLDFSLRRLYPLFSAQCTDGPGRIIADGQRRKPPSSWVYTLFYFFSFFLFFFVPRRR